MTHGMVLVPVGDRWVATCLCGWWQPSPHMMDMAHYDWQQHKDDFMKLEPE